jgi:polyketide biosynthesis enoyl-CoA hydratase PksH
MTGYETLDVRIEDGICRVRLNRPDAGNALNGEMIAELQHVVARCAAGEGEAAVPVLVIEGEAEVFSSGGDFEAISQGTPLDPAPLYDLWTALAAGPFVSIALVRGRANAGGVGLAAACDLVLADRTATFALSELLFGLFPACVLPFLVRRVGVQKAHALTLLTRPIDAEEALRIGLADAVGDAETLLKSHARRLALFSRPAIGRYKAYMARLSDLAAKARPEALDANRAMFADPEVQRNILRYVRDMKLPWEA